MANATNTLGVVFLLWASWAGGTDTVHLLWRVPLRNGGPPPWGTPAVAEGTLWVTSSGVRAYSRNSGLEVWNSKLPRYSPRGIVVGMGRVIVVEAKVSALDANTGRKRWEFTPDANASLGRAVVRGNHLYFGTSSHRVYALRISDGAFLWERDIGPEWKYPAVVRGVAATRTIIYAAVEQWTTETGTSASGWLAALDPNTGKILWRSSIASRSARSGLSSSPVVAGGLVLVSDFLSNAIEAVDRRTGREVWRFEGERGAVGFPEAPLVLHGRVYAASGDRFVYALNLSTGHLLWRTKMSASIGAYTLCGRELLVNFSGLAALDPLTGRVEQTLLSGTDEFLTSDFATSGKESFVAGPEAIYALSCR